MKSSDSFSAIDAVLSSEVEGLPQRLSNDALRFERCRALGAASARPRFVLVRRRLTRRQPARGRRALAHERDGAAIEGSAGGGRGGWRPPAPSGPPRSPRGAV